MWLTGADCLSVLVCGLMRQGLRFYKKKSFPFGDGSSGIEEVASLICMAVLQAEQKALGMLAHPVLGMRAARWSLLTSMSKAPAGQQIGDL